MIGGREALVSAFALLVAGFGLLGEDREEVVEARAFALIDDADKTIAELSDKDGGRLVLAGVRGAAAVLGLKSSDAAVLLVGEPEPGSHVAFSGGDESVGIECGGGRVWPWRIAISDSGAGLSLGAKDLTSRVAMSVSRENRTNVRLSAAPNHDGGVVLQGGSEGHVILGTGPDLARPRTIFGLHGDGSARLRVRTTGGREVGVETEDGLAARWFARDSSGDLIWSRVANK